MKHLIALAALALAPLVHAQYKCVAADGKVSFQQSPCVGKEKQQALVIRATQAPAPSASMAADAAPAPRAPNSEQRLLATMERDRKIRTLQFDIRSTEDAIETRNRQMTAEMDDLKANKRRANNNLAGATWEQSLSTEMRAVADKYKAMNDLDLERLRQMRAELAALQAAAPTR